MLLRFDAMSVWSVKCFIRCFFSFEIWFDDEWCCSDNLHPNKLTGRSSLEQKGRSWARGRGFGFCHVPCVKMILYFLLLVLFFGSLPLKQWKLPVHHLSHREQAHGIFAFSVLDLFCNLLCRGQDLLWILWQRQESHMGNVSFGQRRLGRFDECFCHQCSHVCLPQFSVSDCGSTWTLW